MKYTFTVTYNVTIEASNESDAEKLANLTAFPMKMKAANKFGQILCTDSKVIRLSAS